MKEFPVEVRPLSSLLPHPLNWGVHPERQVAALDQSLSEHGWLAVPIWNKQTGHLLDGHARVEWAREKGQSSIPVRVVDVSPEQEERILLQFNRIDQLRGQDDRQLISLIEKVLATDGALPSGYDDLDVARVRATLAAAEGEGWETDVTSVHDTEETDAPLPAKVIVRCPKDLYTDVRERVEIALEGLEGVTVS